MSMSSSSSSSDVAGVHLVGSGVGGEGYLTVRARALLQQADAVVYDALADDELLALTPPHAARYFVGKRGGERDKSWAQSDIDQLLVSLAAEHRVIVRLKAGDPFIFGRARSELAALEEAGVPCFVEPGLSSALVAPLLAGIALTDAKLSKSFTVMSAFDAQGDAPEDLGALAGVDTLVFLMGGARLGLLMQRLQQSGRAPSTPVVVVKWAGHPQKQRIWRGTLASIEGETGGTKLSPAVIIVGQTAGSPLFAPSSLPSPAPAAPSLSSPPPSGDGSRASERGGEGGGGGGGGGGR
jgi:uroporphyrin-III C-methyltransferase